MARTHGKNTYVSVDGDDLSAYTNASDIERSADSSDTTTYGATAHRHEGGLLDGSFKMSGFYETGVAGPGQTLRPIIGTVVEVVRRVEGTGSAKPEETFSALLVKYGESSPVAEYVQWSAEFEISGAIDDTAQAA